MLSFALFWGSLNYFCIRSILKMSLCRVSTNIFFSLFLLECLSELRDITINKNIQPNSESLIHPATTEAFPRQITKGTRGIFISRVCIQDYSLSGTHPVFAKFVQ